MFQDKILWPLPGTTPGPGPASAVKVVGQNNADPTARYARGLMRFRLENDSTVSGNFAFVRLRIWVDIEYADGIRSYEPDSSLADRIAPDADIHHPMLWADDVFFLAAAPGGAPDFTRPGPWSYEMPAKLFLPMNNNTQAYYSFEYEAIGVAASSVKADFQRSAIPTEIFYGWETMNAATAITLTRSPGFKSISFGQDSGAGDKAPRGYQRLRLYNTSATDWAGVRVRVWAHHSGA
jgi:hypothetical protein